MIYGAKLIAQALYDLDVKVIFGLPGLPAASYAATAYGYLTGRPGVCLVVGGPGVLQIPHAAANAWPLMVLAGSSEMHNANKGAFQEMDAISLLTPHTKLAVRPSYEEQIPAFVEDAYRRAYFGRPGPTFVDLPANMILGTFDIEPQRLSPLKEAPLPTAPENKVRDVAQALKRAKAPLVVIGKGAAYSRAERQIRTLVERTGIPFVPTPMGKGVVQDSSANNVSSARSTALKEADVVLVLGARLNWILSFGHPPKWNPNAKIIQVDINADEIGKNGGDSSLGLVGDIALVVDQLNSHIGDWRWQGQSSDYLRSLQGAKSKNEDKAAKKAAVDKVPMAYEKVFDVMKTTLNSLSSPEEGDIVYVSEGANAMDISRSIFTMEHPRIRLDAGTYATMGVGLGYSIAAYAAYNFSKPEGSAGSQKRKKIVAIEGDSAIGMSAMEIETMSRFKMDIMIFVMNNSGLYKGDSESSEEWQKRQQVTSEGGTATGTGLSALSLGYETDYQKMAEMCGGLGFVVRTPDELKEATEKGFKARVPVIINVIIDQGSDVEMDFSWLDMAPPKKKEQKL